MLKVYAAEARLYFEAYNRRSARRESNYLVKCINCGLLDSAGKEGLYKCVRFAKEVTAQESEDEIKCHYYLDVIFEEGQRLNPRTSCKTGGKLQVGVSASEGENRSEPCHTRGIGSASRGRAPVPFFFISDMLKTCVGTGYVPQYVW